MRFLDPMPVTCPSCGEEEEYKVSDLLALQAFCKVCGYNLASVGHKMRAAINYTDKMFSLIDLALKLEDKLNIQIEDADLEPLLENNSAKISDFLDLTIAKLPVSHNYEEVRQQVYEIIALIGDVPVKQLAAEMNLAEALGVLYQAQRN